MEKNQKLLIALIAGIVGYFLFVRKEDSVQVLSANSDLVDFFDEDDEDLEEELNEYAIKQKINKGIIHEMNEGKPYEEAKKKAVQEINMNPMRYE